ncbi:MAG TPA: hypothetical protein DCY93_00575 [Firmicutes bacterium]|nr:hypothetical protein [Bacillota bacterium]
MKKHIAAISLVSLLTCGVLASCNSSPVKWEEGVILKIGDEKYTIDDAYRDLAGLDLGEGKKYNITADGAKAYYTVVNNVLIQLAVPTTETMKSLVEQEIDEKYYQAAKDNASNNGTSVKEEKEKILSDEGVDSVDELRSKYLLARKQTRNSNDFYSDSNYKAMTPEYVETKSPYHVRHILVKIDTTSSLYRSTISESNAKKIYNVVKRLASKETFGQVALTASDDTSSSDYGDVGIMTTDTEFVSEFKYSLYGYDAYFNGKVTDKAMVKDRLAIPSDADSVIGEKNFGIPLTKILDLNKYADVTNADSKLAVENASEVNYPRNILFSSYLNNHGTSYIYLDDTVENIKSNYGIDINASRFKTVDGLSTSLKKIESTSSGDSYTTQYQDIADSKQVLCDETGNPIIVTRAGSGTSESGYQGIHFIIAQRSPFVDMTSKDSSNNEVNNIAAYYSLDIPSTTSEEETDVKPTYINFIKTDDRSIYEKRATTIRESIKAFDANMEFRIFENNLKSAQASNIQINTKVKEIVDSYISITRENAKYSKEKSYQQSWTNFIELLKMQQALVGRTFPEEECIRQFKSGEITKGGVCDASK